MNLGGHNMLWFGWSKIRRCPACEARTKSGTACLNRPLNDVRDGGAWRRRSASSREVREARACGHLVVAMVPEPRQLRCLPPSGIGHGCRGTSAAWSKARLRHTFLDATPSGRPGLSAKV